MKNVNTLVNDDIKQIYVIQRFLMSYFNKETLVTKIVELIDNSKFIDFTDERSRKFLNKDRPLFNLKFVNLPELKEEYDEPEDTEVGTVSRWMTDIVHKEVVIKFSDYMISAITNIKDNKEAFTELPDSSLMDDVGYFLSSLFSYRLDPERMTFTVEYIML